MRLQMTPRKTIMLLWAAPVSFALAVALVFILRGRI